MTTARRRRLSASRQAVVRYSSLLYQMSRPLDQGPDTERMRREQSWYVSALASGSTTPFGSLAVHRVPLNNGEDVVLLTDSGDDVPGDAVGAVVDWDTPTRAVRTRLPEWVNPDDPAANFLVVEPVELEPEWRGLGVGELLLATVLTDLQGPDDIMAVAAPVKWHLKGRARNEAGLVQRPIVEHLGFQPIRASKYLLTDWAKLTEALYRYQAKFGLEVGSATN